ncbi:hypothetical protein P691DRAFT_781013 [Macrolepiota fuliginosa MF-IS2]|uniref:Uncharacterized protein n=1 Tax=Macrolepiota fuliginosa MF-IS2 TaxID=1400762 RepID=A0A9P5WYQ3_9AGAR|nr:hypothetical protein P691DRAFT_781013 [Macrolepiota fuliginosa MF-IS2]
MAKDNETEVSCGAEGCPTMFPDLERRKAHQFKCTYIHTYAVEFANVHLLVHWDSSIGWKLKCNCDQKQGGYQKTFDSVPEREFMTVLNASSPARIQGAIPATSAAASAELCSEPGALQENIMLGDFAFNNNPKIEQFNGAGNLVGTGGSNTIGGSNGTRRSSGAQGFSDAGGSDDMGRSDNPMQSTTGAPQASRPVVNLRTRGATLLVQLLGDVDVVWRYWTVQDHNPSSIDMSNASDIQNHKTLTKFEL